MYHLCIIIILYKREGDVRRAMHGGWWHTHMSKHSFLSLSLKHIFILFPFMQKFYSDNRCHGVSYCFVRYCYTYIRGIPGTNVYTIFPSIFAVFSAPIIFVLHSVSVLLYSSLSVFNYLVNIRCRFLRLSLLTLGVFHQPPPPCH